MNTQDSLVSNTATPVAESVVDIDRQRLNTLPGQAQTLSDSVAIALDNYFSHLDGQDVTDVYDMVLSEVEAPLLEAVMKYTRNNQTKASVMLGLNRGTLRKKLKQYGLL